MMDKAVFLFLKSIKKCSVVIFMCILICFIAVQDCVSESDYYYGISNNGAVIRKYGGDEIDVVVPKVLGGYPVTEIGPSAFERNERIKSVVLPDSIQKIGSWAFAQCYNLEVINIPSKTSDISNHAFYFCSSLKSIVLSESVYSIQSSVFEGCSALTNVVLSENTDSIDPYAFRKCSSLTEINMPDNISSISRDSFKECRATIYANRNSKTARRLSGVGLDFIDPEYPHLKLLAYETNHVRSFTVTRCVNSEIEEIRFPENVTKIGNSALSGCTKIKSIHIPSTVNYIDISAFTDCSSLLSLSIPYGVPGLYSYATYGCSSLSSIVIPESVVTIADNALSDSIQTVYCWKGSVADTWAKKKNRNIIYLDNTDISVHTVFVGEEMLNLEVSDERKWKTLADLVPMPFEDNLTFQCTSSDSDVVRIEGEKMYVCKPGKATITITVEELPKISHSVIVTTYNPVASFEIPLSVFLKVGQENVLLKPENISPKKTNPLYFWQYEDSEIIGEQESFYVSADLEPGRRILNITAQSGVTRKCEIITYQNVEEISFGEFSCYLVPGMTIKPQITVILDGVSYHNESALYTLTSSDETIARIAEGGRIEVVGNGTATITAQAFDGQSTSQVLAISEMDVLVLPDHTCVIESEAFYGCNANLVIIPENCEVIGARAFANSMELREIIIPDSVRKIADDAFEGCRELSITAEEESCGQTFAEENGLIWRPL